MHDNKLEASHVMYTCQGGCSTSARGRAVVLDTVVNECSYYLRKAASRRDSMPGMFYAVQYTKSKFSL